MHLVLHIGTEKTGTTSVQAFFRENRARMLSDGVWHAESLGGPDHRGLAVLARRGDDPDDAFHRFHIHSPEDHARFVAETTERLRAEIAAAKATDARTFLISNEHLQSRLYDQESVARVADLLRPLFDSHEVLCVLRPQIEAVLSLTSTEARVGLEVSRRRFEWVDPTVHYFNYLGLLERWADGFGSETILPVAFNRHRDMIGFFRHHLGLEGDGYQTVRPSNRRLDHRAIAFANRLALPVFLSPGTPNPNRTVFFDDLPVEAPLTLSRDFARDIQARFDPGNAEIAARWPTITLDDLTPDWSRYPEIGTLDQLESCDTGPILRYVVQRLNAELHFSKALTEQQRARVAHFNENYENALRFIDDALANLAAAAMFNDAEGNTDPDPQFEPMADRAARVRAQLEEHREIVAARRPAQRAPRETSA